MAKRTGWSKESRHKRGYGSEWDRLRLTVLKRDNGLCQCSRCKGGKIRLTAANEVDHILPKAKGGTDDISNLQAINSECHMIKTTEENGNKYIKKVRIGNDGFPVRVGR